MQTQGMKEKIKSSGASVTMSLCQILAVRIQKSTHSLRN
jgi:hypothetical protein